MKTDKKKHCEDEGRGRAGWYSNKRSASPIGAMPLCKALYVSNVILYFTRNRMGSQ